MAANALVQTRIDAAVRDRASAVLESMGLTVSDDVRIMLTRTANEGALPLELLTGSEAHDAWFRTTALETLNDTRPDVADDEAEAHFAKRREAARLKAGAHKPRSLFGLRLRCRTATHLDRSAYRRTKFAYSI